MREQAEPTGHSQSLARGLAILSLYTPARPLVGVSDAAREVALSRSTAHRYIATLASLGYLEQDPATRKYRLGPRVVDLGFSAINSMEIREISAPHVQRLSDETGYTSNLAVLDGTDALVVDRVRSSRQKEHQVELNIHIGSRLPLYCSSTGKALLAGLPPVEAEALLERIELSPRGPNTITDRAALAAELARIRDSGLAVNDEELAYGLRSLAAPIRTRSGGTVAAINLAVPRSTHTIGELVRTLGPALKQAAGEIAARTPHGG